MWNARAPDDGQLKLGATKYYNLHVGCVFVNNIDG